MLQLIMLCHMVVAWLLDGLYRVQEFLFPIELAGYLTTVLVETKEDRLDDVL